MGSRNYFDENFIAVDIDKRVLVPDNVDSEIKSTISICIKRQHPAAIWFITGYNAIWICYESYEIGTDNLRLHKCCTQSSWITYRCSLLESSVVSWNYYSLRFCCEIDYHDMDILKNRLVDILHLSCNACVFWIKKYQRKLSPLWN